MERYSELLPFHYETASVTVEAERRVAPPALTRMHYRLDLVTDEPTNRIELLHRNVRKFGTITNTLAAALELTGEVVARNSGEESRPDTDPAVVSCVDHASTVSRETSSPSWWIFPGSSLTSFRSRPAGHFPIRD